MSSKLFISPRNDHATVFVCLSIYIFLKLLCAFISEYKEISACFKPMEPTLFMFLKDDGLLNLCQDNCVTYN